MNCSALEMGEEVARRTLKKIREAFDDVGATLEFRVRRLKELAEFKGKKPFSYDGEIVYSEPLDFPDVQIKAIHEINLMCGSHAPAKQEISGPEGRPIQFSDLERANRLRHLIETAKKRAGEAADGSGKDVKQGGGQLGTAK